jgi:hypothetical protein
MSSFAKLTPDVCSVCRDGRWIDKFAASDLVRSVRTSDTCCLCSLLDIPCFFLSLAWNRAQHFCRFVLAIFILFCSSLSALSSALSIIKLFSLSFVVFAVCTPHHSLNYMPHAHLLSLFPSILMVNSLPPLCSREQGRHRASCDRRSYPSRPSSHRGQGIRALMLHVFLVF